MPAAHGTSRLRLRILLVVLAPLWAAILQGQLLAQGQRRPADQPLEPIRYTVSFPAPLTHYVEVEARFPTGGQPHIDLMMAVWTPGSYLVREYARHVEEMSAVDPGRMPLAVAKTRKNRWRVQTNGSASVLLRYRVYAHEMSVRTNWVDDEFALLNGAPTFITLLESQRRPHEVAVRRPTSWARTLSGMPAGPAADTFLAPDYDTLVDSPILAGNPAVYEFSAAGKPHFLVNVGEGGVWDGGRAVQDLARVVERVAAFWPVVPYDRYYFFNIIGASAGGLEHLNSTVLTTPRDSSGTRQTYLGWLRLAAHEFFHAWNVKRLRPVELGPFDYENEVYTKALWFAEGVTEYYADLLSRRAGLLTPAEYLTELSEAIGALQATPGRLVQPAEMASYDAWIKYYRPDENSSNTSISYYTKGSIIGFLLDARLRRATRDARSLDDFMWLMYRRFSGERGFTSRDLRAAAAEIAGPADAAELASWFVRVLETTDELDYREALDWYGLAIERSTAAPRAWLGVVTRADTQRTTVVEVRRGSPAQGAGIDIGDEIVSIGGLPIAPGQLAARLERLAPGSSVAVALSRQGVARTVELILGNDPVQAWSLVPRADAPPDREASRRMWMGE